MAFLVLMLLNVAIDHVKCEQLYQDITRSSSSTAATMKPLARNLIKSFREILREFRNNPSLLDRLHESELIMQQPWYSITSTLYQFSKRNRQQMQRIIERRSTNLDRDLSKVEEEYEQLSTENASLKRTLAQLTSSRTRLFASKQKEITFLQNRTMSIQTKMEYYLTQKRRTDASRCENLEEMFRKTRIARNIQLKYA